MSLPTILVLLAWTKASTTSTFHAILIPNPPNKAYYQQPQMRGKGLPALNHLIHSMNAMKESMKYFVLALCLAASFGVGSVAADQYPQTKDLVSHLLKLLQSPTHTRINFELGLTYQLLAGSARSDPMSVANLLPEDLSDELTLPFSEEDLKKKSIESYTLCLKEVRYTTHVWIINWFSQDAMLITLYPFCHRIPTMSMFLIIWHFS